MPSSLPLRPHTPRPSRRLRRAGQMAALTTLGLVGLLAGLLSGCSSSAGSASSTPGASTATSAGTETTRNYSAASGNWRFTTASSRLAVFSGSLAVSGSAVTGTLHPVAGTCLAALSSPSHGFPVTGSVDSSGNLSLSSSTFSGGPLSIQGALASDQHSLVNPTITVGSGACATASAHSPLSARDGSSGSGSTAQQYQALTGTYTGSLTSSYGGSLAISVDISQGASPDSDGNYHLTGNATFADTSCIHLPVVTDSVVTGNQISVTYTDGTTGNTVTGSGTFSADAQTLTISTWTLSGSCGNDTGSGLLSRSTH